MSHTLSCLRRCYCCSCHDNPCHYETGLCWYHRWVAERNMAWWRARGRRDECLVSLTANVLKWIQLVGRLCARNSCLSQYSCVGSLTLITLFTLHTSRHIKSGTHWVTHLFFYSLNSLALSFAHYLIFSIIHSFIGACLVHFERARRLSGLVIFKGKLLKLFWQKECS